MSDVARTDGRGGASPDRAARRADAEDWLPDGFEVVDEGPPVGSIAVGAFGVGFDLFEPGRGKTASYDPDGNEVPESLVGLPPDALIGDFVDFMVVGKAPMASPGSMTIPGAEDADEAPLTVGEAAEGQEEALRSTALPGRVELDGNELAERLAKDPTDFGIVHDRSLD